MDLGKIARDAFEMAFDDAAGDVLVHRNWGKPSQVTTQHRALKNFKPHVPNDVRFQFLERIEVSRGDVIQQTVANDLWEVVDTEDRVTGNTLAHFDVVVENASPNARRRESSASVVVHGHNYGGIQLGNDRSTQSIVYNASEVGKTVESLKSLVANSDLKPVDREEVADALDRVVTLEQRREEPGVIARIREKLGLARDIIGTSRDTASVGLPMIDALGQYFG